MSKNSFLRKFNKNNLMRLFARTPFIRRRKCILCGRSSAFFLPHGYDLDIFKTVHIIGGGRRKNAICPYCGACDRYLLCYYVLKNCTDMLTAECKVLHFAPELALREKICANKKCKYTSADLREGYADCVVDVTKMQFDDNSFDYIIINHVMEHVADEAAAMHELYRCLVPGGIVVLSAPVCTDCDTFDNVKADTPEERERIYGQCDHIRLYGRDFGEYFTKYGFKVKKCVAEEMLGKEQAIKYGMIPDDSVLLLTK